MIICLNPKEESRPAGMVKGRFHVRFAYTRAKGSQKPDGTGEDFLITRVEERRTTFALCDGVSQSFMGNEAARLVGEDLIAWLWERCDENQHLTLRETMLVASLTAHLNRLTEYATQQVQKISLPNELPKMVKEVLEDRRKLNGSQTNFVCGFVEARSARFPNGLVGLLWLGNAKLRVWKNKNDVTPLLEATWNDEEAWSSRHGVIGNIHCFIGNLNDIDKVMAYSDGMDDVESLLRPGITDEELEKSISQLQKQDSDDISYFELSYGATQAASVFDGAAQAAAIRMRTSLDTPRYLNFDGKFAPLQEQMIAQVNPLPSQGPTAWHPIPPSENNGTVPFELADSYDPVLPTKKHPHRQINNFAALSMIGLCLFMMIGAILLIRDRGVTGGSSDTEGNPSTTAPVVEQPVFTSTIRPKNSETVHKTSTPSPVLMSGSSTLTPTSIETETFIKTPVVTPTTTPTLPPPSRLSLFIDWLLQIIFPTE